MEAELKEYRLQLESVEAALKADPDNEGLHTLANELKEVIALTETVIAEEQGATVAAAAPKPTTSSSGGKRSHDSRNNSSTPGINDSYTNSNHYHSVSSANSSTAAAAAGGAPAHTFSVGDNVLAKWTSGDNAFYPARITSITGSSKNPVYIVKFSSYNVSETLNAHQVKPLSESHQKKRKLDATTSVGSSNGVTSGSASPAPVTNSAIISQPANINAALAEQSKKPAQPLDGLKQTKSAKRVKHQRELNESKNKWQAFAAKGVKTASGRTKKIGESSMFRTPEGVHGRVGFTGSGQPMRKEINTRGKHIYQQGEADEE